MTIKTYTGFSKRKNSTKQPGTGTDVVCTLKEGTSIESPVFLLNSNDFTINYIKAFDHYYFVEDIKSVRNGLIEISCSMDVLATFKSAIGSYSAFIERADSSSNINIDLPDPLVAIENNERILTQTTSGLGVFSSSGYFILSVLNTVGSGAGFTSYYMMDISAIEFVAAYCNTPWGSSATDILDWLQSTFLKTADSVIDCIWVPFSLAATTGLPMTAEPVEIGVDTLPAGATGWRLTGVCVASETITVSIPSTGYSDFRKGSPYTAGKLFIPCYGVVDFNPLDFPNDTISMKFDCDIATGDVACYLYNSNNVLISSYTYNVAVSCPVGKVGANVTGTGTGLLTTLAGVASAATATGGYAVAAGIGATASGINTLANALAPTVSVRGAKGGRALAERGTDPIVTLICKETTDPAELLTQHGGLVMEKHTISSLSGYIQCSNASVPIAGMGNEKDAVNNFLNSGFYYE